MGPKFIVLGLDGATWSLMSLLRERGIIPNISRIMTEGAYGNLQSTFPPVSSTAWTSFMTGKNPGKHGIFNFNVKPFGTYYLEPVISTDIHGVTLWQYLSHLGKKVAVINVPMTYPPEEVNGIMISGMGTPADSVSFTHPLSLYDDINRDVGKYILDTPWVEFDDENIEQLIEALEEMTVNRCETAAYCMEKDNWDLFMLVFVGTDRIQHRLWKYINIDGRDDLSEREQAISDRITEYFSLIDSRIGKLLARRDDDTNILFLSDHGFGPFYRRVNLNNWLVREQYLAYKKEKNRKNPLINIARTVLKGLNIDRAKLQEFISNTRLNVDMYKYLEKGSSIINKIDWSKTKAFSYSCNSLYINLKGREREGIVSEGAEYEDLCDELTEKLFSIKNPLTGGPIVKKVNRKNELYSGEFLDAAPDLVITEYDERFWFGYWGRATMYFDENKLDIFESDHVHTGQHTLDGLYIASGKAFKKSFRYDNANIIDLFPTILYLLGLPIPDDVDGRVLEEIILESSLSEKKVMQSEDMKISDRKHKLSEKERESIQDQLKGLGYM